MSVLVKSATRPECVSAIEQASGVWLCSDDCKATAAKAADIASSLLPHPEGGGRRMLRHVPAGVVLIEVDPMTAKVVSEIAAKPIDEKPIEEVSRAR